MQRPDEDILKAILNLRGNPNWDRIIVWFRDSFGQVMHVLGDNTVFNAGRAAELGDLLERIHTAPTELEKLEKFKQGGLSKTPPAV